MTLGDVLLFLSLVLIALELARVLLRRRRARTNTFTDSAWSLGAAAVASFAIAASQPRPPPPPPPPQPPPDERRQKTPAQGVPIAHAPDAGAGDGGPASMLATEPVERWAGDTAIAARCGNGFDEVPCPVDDPQPR